MIKNMVKELTLSIMGTSMKENGRMVKDGTEQNTAKAETSNKSG